MSPNQKPTDAASKVGGKIKTKDTYNTMGHECP